MLRISNRFITKCSVFIMLSLILMASSCNDAGNNKPTIESEQSVETSLATLTNDTQTDICKTESSSFPEKLFIEDYIAEELYDKMDNIKNARDYFSSTNKFIDFEYIHDPESSTISAEEKINAEECVKASEYFTSHREYFDTVGKDMPDPIFDKGYEYDFDGDGVTEKFLTVSAPAIYEPSHEILQSVLVFEDNAGNMTAVSQIDELSVVSILDYGEFKQFMFGGTGFFGYNSHSAIFGVCSDKIKLLMDKRVGYAKQGCFLSCLGWQNEADFLIYDTNEQQYRSITGYSADSKKLAELDKDNIIFTDDVSVTDEKQSIFIISEKYVVRENDRYTYEYENGGFKKYDFGELFSIYPLLLKNPDDCFDVDIEYALSVSGAEFLLQTR